MGLVRAKGNMYEWVTHCHTHLGGECSHKCVYCYVNRNRIPKYRGEVRLIEKELKVDYGRNKTIFIEHCNDLFSTGVHDNIILQILEHCNAFSQNTFVIQTKNPLRCLKFSSYLPNRCVLGTTIETNRDTSRFSAAPPPIERMWAMTGYKQHTFVTIEPIMDFDIDVLAGWMCLIKPLFVNIGADSKGHNLPEPLFERVEHLIAILREAGIKVQEKSNLERLKKRKDARG